MVGSTLTPDKYPNYIYNVSWDNQNPRSKRAIQLLDPDHHVTEEKAKAICMDVHDILADTWKQALRDAIKSSGGKHMKNADFAAAIQAILDWDGQYLPESTATPVYNFWRLKAGKALNLAPLGKKQPLTRRRTPSCSISWQRRSPKCKSGTVNGMSPGANFTRWVAVACISPSAAPTTSRATKRRTFRKLCSM